MRPDPVPITLHSRKELAPQTLPFAEAQGEHSACHSQSWLQHSGELLLGCHTFEALLDVTGTLLRRNLGIDTLQISLIERHNGSLRQVRVLDARDRPHRGAEQIYRATEYVRWPWIPALRAGAPYALDTLPVHPFQPSTPGARGITQLSLPLRAERRLIGWVHLANNPGQAPISESLVPLLRPFTPLLALALVTVDLLEAQRHAIRDLEEARRCAESALQLEVVISAMSDGVMIYDAGRHITLMNDAARHQLGIQGPDDALVPEYIRYPHGELMPEAQWPPVQALAGELFRGDILAGPPGRERLLRVLCSPIRARDGSITGAVSVLHDVTEEQRLARAHEDFAATVSHEMRTPLTTIIGFLELADSRWPLLSDQRRHEMVKRAATGAHRLESLVQNLLLASRFEAGQSGFGDVLPSDSLVLAGLVRRLADDIAEIYSQDRIHVRCRGPQVEGWWPILPLERILTNLIDNAAKYSPPEGLVTVAWVLHDHSLVLRVRDRGPGIPPADRDRLFLRFSRISGGTRTGRTGTGLGLYICRELVTRLHGTIAYYDAPRTGACMVVTLPLHV